MKPDIKTEYIVNNSGIEYVGINLIDNKISIHLPIGYRVSKDEVNSKVFKNDIKKLFELLALRGNNGYESRIENGNFNLISAVRILEDYIKYGLYQENEKEIKNNIKGKINWHRTLNKKQLYINNKIIYNNIYYNRINYNAEMEIQNIQKYCLNSVSKVIGEYWNISFFEDVKEEHNKNEMIEILKNEMKKVNQDKKLDILKNLLNFLNEIKFDLIENKNIFFKYKEFEYIWQNLIDIQGIKGNKKKKYQPKAKYYLFNGSEYEDKKVKPSLPDTIIIDDDMKIVFVLDAKYYAQGNLPNEYDIFKQTRYGEYVKSKLKDDGKEQYNIINAFILPKELESLEVEIQDKIAFSEKDNLKEEINSYEIIWVAYVDTRKLINTPNEIIEKLKKELVEKYNNNFEKIKDSIKVGT